MLRPNGYFLLLACIAALQLHAQTDTLGDRMLTGHVRDLLGDADTAKHEGFVTEIVDMVSQQVEEAPGIVYVLTADEIAASGARDLDEALMLIPSFIPGRDEDDLVGFSIRGNWALEGKCLFMLNGMPLNEASFGTFSVGMRIPLDNVSRIEVINGPGSVHGSFAALGAVNIITKDIRDGEGMEVAVTNSQVTDAHRRWANFHGRHRLSEVSELTYAANAITGPRFTGTLPTYKGPINYSDSTMSQTMNGYFSVRRKGFRAQLWGSDHSFAVDDEPYTIRMRTLMAQGEQNLVLTKNTRLTFGGLYRHQLPWWHENDSNWTHHPFNTIDQRTMVNGMLLTHPRQGLQIRLGVQASMDQSRFSTRTPGPVFERNGRADITTWDGAVFGEVVVRGRAGTFIGGARAASNSLSGQYIAPRVAYTKLLGRWNAKFLASKTYKPPTAQNINRHWGEGTLNAESVWTMEAEVGYRPTSGTTVSLCAFDTRVEDLIVAQHDEEGLGYINRGASATRGLELCVHHKARSSGIYLSASTYAVQRMRSDLEDSELPEPYDKGYHGVPQHKIAAVLYWKPWTTGRIDLRGVWTSETYSYLHPPGAVVEGEEDEEAEAEGHENLELVRFADVLRLDAGVSFSFKRMEGFRVRLGCENILDRTAWTLSPHGDGDSALPNAGRQWTIKLEYRFAL
jgi:outer membrane receptor protein involved in Fe transport